MRAAILRVRSHMLAPIKWLHLIRKWRKKTNALRRDFILHDTLTHDVKRDIGLMNGKSANTTHAMPLSEKRHCDALRDAINHQQRPL